MYYLYILFSPLYNLYYIGYTSNYHQRLIQHNTQEFFNTYTSKYRPWQLSAVFECGSEEKEAIRLERFIKKQKNRKLIETLVNPDFEPVGQLAQLVRVPHVRD
jgi:putative endonuclease